MIFGIITLAAQILSAILLWESNIWLSIAWVLIIVVQLARAAFTAGVSSVLDDMKRK